MTADRRFFRCFGALVLATVALTGTAAALGLKWNATPSYPRGLWRVTSAGWRPGDLVFVRVPAHSRAFAVARARGYLREGVSRSGLAPLLKRVVAVPGDLVVVNGNVAVNGRILPNSEIRRTDAAGRALPSSAPTGRVPAGYVWVMSDHSPSSFDSRYFGALPTSSILGRAELLWTP